MSRSLMLIILGALVFIAPFSGLPMNILAWILPVFGLALVAIGVAYRRNPPTLRPAYEADTSASL